MSFFLLFLSIVLSLQWCGGAGGVPWYRGPHPGHRAARVPPLHLAGRAQTHGSVASRATPPPASLLLLHFYLFLLSLFLFYVPTAVPASSALIPFVAFTNFAFIPFAFTSFCFYSCFYFCFTPSAFTPSAFTPALYSFAFTPSASCFAFILLSCVHFFDLAPTSGCAPEMEVTEIILANVSRLCQQSSHSHGFQKNFLSRLQILKSIGPSLWISWGGGMGSMRTRHHPMIQKCFWRFLW